MTEKKVNIGTDVVAWRLTAVENAVTAANVEISGLRKEVLDKLDGIASGFATHKDIEVAKEQARLEHKTIYDKIGDIETDILNLKRRTWINNTLSAILGVVLTFLTIYAITGILD